MESSVFNEPLLKVRSSASELVNTIFNMDNEPVLVYLDHVSKQLRSGQVDYLSKESLLYILEKCIGPIVSDLKSKMDSFTENILIPALEIQNPYVQARACSLISLLDDIEISNLNYVSLIAEKLFGLLSSDFLLLKVKAIKGLAILLTIDECQEGFRPHIQLILQTIFSTMEKIKTKDLSDCIQTISCDYQKEVQPYALQLTNNLLESFWDQANRVDVQEQEEVIENID